MRGREAARERRSEERWNAVGARGFKSWPAVLELPRRVDAVPGRRRRVAPRGGQALTRSGAWRGDGCGAREKEPARWAGPRRGEARAGASLGRLRPWARSEAAAREGGKSLFHLYFQGIFKCHLSNIILSKKMTSFENVPKMKVA